METQNITLSIPKKVLMKFKEMAMRRQKSISGLMVEMIEREVSNEEGYSVARARFLRRINENKDLGTDGKAAWTREDLHER
jgi:hypothetical protein